MHRPTHGAEGHCEADGQQGGHCEGDAAGRQRGADPVPPEPHQHRAVRGLLGGAGCVHACAGFMWLCSFMSLCNRMGVCIAGGVKRTSKAIPNPSIF